MRSTEDFYVGYLPHASVATHRFLMCMVIVLIILVIVTALLLAKNQKKFSNGVFEKNNITTLTGIYSDDPVPNIQLLKGRDEKGTAVFVSIPLIGYGKHGAAGIVSTWEEKYHMRLDRKKITVRGRLIYNDGKTWMEVNDAENKMMTPTSGNDRVIAHGSTLNLGAATLHGEIVDPKCYFGVMKPGEGKPHRDCAARCISGGMPPTLVIKNEKGESNYVLLLGSKGEPINRQVLSYVAEPVAVSGNLVQVNDWTVMYLDPGTGIERQSGRNPGELQTEQVSNNCSDGCRMKH